jgi:glycosyltransferase involved in cell wall biosynthesis
MPKVSIIIPCHNLGEYILECVESALNQLYDDFEIIIVDDGSTDDYTLEVLDSIHHQRVQILRTRNQGLAAARNNGILKAQGKYICCLDADDKYHPEYLQKTVPLLDRSSNLGIVTTWVQTFGESEKIWKTYEYNPMHLAFENVIHVASLFRKECWEKVKGYKTNLAGYQDWDLWISIVAKGYRWEVVEECLFYYRVRKNSMINNSDKNRLGILDTIISNNIEFYEKNAQSIILEFEEARLSVINEIGGNKRLIDDLVSQIKEKDWFLRRLKPFVKILSVMKQKRKKA